jgi:hypothetical protein
MKREQLTNVETEALCNLWSQVAFRESQQDTADRFDARRSYRAAMLADRIIALRTEKQA